jgi:biotin transport system substrate-specific component
MSRFRLTASDLARIAVFAAIVAVLGLPGGLSVFGGVPITAQTLGVMLAGAILGPWRGALSMVVFLALVAIGLPLLSGGRGGAGVFAGASAGYLVGWIAGAFVIGLIVHLGGRRLTWTRTAIGIVLGGIVTVYAFGIPVQAFVTRIPLAQTAQLSAVFLPGDLVKAAIATAITMTLVRAYPRAFRRDIALPSGSEGAGAAKTTEPASTATAASGPTAASADPDRTPAP